MRTNDPMERLVEQALIDAGIRYVTDFGGENSSGLDFRLLESGIEIEVKRFHSERIVRQMKRAPNVIVAQGRDAVEYLASLIRGEPFAKERNDG